MRWDDEAEEEGIREGYLEAPDWALQSSVTSFALMDSISSSIRRPHSRVTLVPGTLSTRCLLHSLPADLKIFHCRLHSLPAGLKTRTPIPLTPVVTPPSFKPICLSALCHMPCPLSHPALQSSLRRVDLTTGKVGFAFVSCFPFLRVTAWIKMAALQTYKGRRGGEVGFTGGVTGKVGLPAGGESRAERRPFLNKRVQRQTAVRLGRSEIRNSSKH